MGGERFDTPQPEAYLFGENADLNFLGSRPTPVCTVFNHLTFPILQTYIFKSEKVDIIDRFTVNYGERLSAFISQC